MIDKHGNPAVDPKTFEPLGTIENAINLKLKALEALPDQEYTQEDKNAVKLDGKEYTGEAAELVKRVQAVQAKKQNRIIA